MGQATQKSSPSILDVQNSRTRDYLRGLLTRQEEAGTRATFYNLMSSLTTEDMATVDTLLRNNSLFSHLTLSNEFPPDERPFFSSGSLLVVPRAPLRARYIVLRASSRSFELSEAFKSANAWNRVLFSGSDREILAATSNFSDSFGHSLLFARKLAFILGHLGKDMESWRLASAAFASYGINARNYGMMAVADSIGFEFGYLDLKMGFEEFADCSAKSHASQKLAHLSFHPLAFNRDAILEGIAAMYSFSLLDAVHYVLCHRELGLLDEEVTFTQDIESAWEEMQRSDHRFEQFFHVDRNQSDSQAFRASTAFLEHVQFRNFRASTQRLYDHPDARVVHVGGNNDFESQFYRSVSSIKDLLPSESGLSQALPGSFDRATAGSLARSCGLVRVAEANPDFSTLDKRGMAGLMGNTIDVDHLLSTTTLRLSAKSATDSFVRLILQTLLRAHSPSTRDNFDFKQSLQAYVVAQHNGDILGLLEEIIRLSPDIIPYFIQMLDETLLSQLPYLVRTAEEVYETRARLLEWYANETGDEGWKSKAGQLRIDRKIAAVRGQINETRLNIDSLRFRQWIESTKIAEFSSFIRQDVITLPEAVDFKNRKGWPELRMSALRDPTARALVAVTDCYREFCTNADFGVASYLGRRIRHGTLRGTLLDGLPDPEDFDLSSVCAAQFDHWLDTFKSSIDAIISKLHFSGKGASNRAVISPEIDSREKWDVLSVCVGTIYERSQVDQGALTIPLTIEQYCWYIFEIELHDVQNAILESRNEFGMFKMKYGAGERDAIRFERAVNVGLSARFNTVASWFRKPPNISPVAEIGDIVNVILQETKAEYPSYDPKTQLVGTELILSGGVYYFVYDALSVILKNAGKHGAHPGILKLNVQSEEREVGKMLRIDALSNVAADDTVAAAVARMAEAGEAGPTNADVIEGLSGVRKLQKMKLDSSIVDFESFCEAGATDLLRVTVWFRLSGLVS